MGLNVDTIARYVVQNHNVNFMKEGDYATASKEDAQSIYKFLNDKNARTARQEELTAYLLGMKDEQGKDMFTYKSAAAAAKQQLENEISQKRAQTTITFIDENDYKQALEKAQKEGTDKLYTFNLIKDKELLNEINTNKDKYFTKDASGKEVFDTDKFKAEFGKDVGTDNKLQLAERQVAAKNRGISANAEKNAIKAAGLDYRRDNTGLYRTLVGTAAAAAVVFGGATAVADAYAHSGGATAIAHSVAKTKIGNIVAGGVGALALPFIHDKDGKTNKRQKAADLFAQKEKAEEPVKVENKVEEKVEEKAKEKVEEKVDNNPKPEVKKDDCDNLPCYNIEEGVMVNTIPYGGYWHYAQLYNNCDTNKPLTNKQISELTQLLKPGHEQSSIQEYRDEKTNKLIRSKRILQNTITLKDGTKVCLADDEEIKARVAKMKTHSGGRDMALGSKSVNVWTCDGKFIGHAGSVAEANKLGKQYQQQHKK